jgi:hypothetical protein
MAQFIGLGRNGPHDRRRKGNHLEEDEAEEETEKEQGEKIKFGVRSSEFEVRSSIKSGGQRSDVRGRGRIKLGVRSSEPGEDAPLDRVKDDDEEDGRFHQGDGPEIHSSKGNGSKNNEKKEDKLDGVI